MTEKGWLIAVLCCYILILVGFIEWLGVPVLIAVQSPQLHGVGMITIGLIMLAYCAYRYIEIRVT